MSCPSSKSNGCSAKQCLVDQTPRYEQKNRRGSQVIGKKSKIIRRDKRKKVKYL